MGLQPGLLPSARKSLSRQYVVPECGWLLTLLVSKVTCTRILARYLADTSWCDAAECADPFLQRTTGHGSLTMLGINTDSAGVVLHIRWTLPARGQALRILDWTTCCPPPLLAMAWQVSLMELLMQRWRCLSVFRGEQSCCTTLLAPGSSEIRPRIMAERLVLISEFVLVPY